MSEFNKYRLKGAYHYDWYETEDWYRWLVDRCVKFCKGTVIDIGCGDGLLVYKLLQNGCKAYGYEPDVQGYEIARQTLLDKGYPLNIDTLFVNDSLEQVLESPNSWEYLTCLNVVEHLENPQLLKELIKKKIRKGAIITTIDYQGGTLGYDHKFEWTYDEMMEFFKEFNPKGFRYKDTEWIGVEITK